MRVPMIALVVAILTIMAVVPMIEGTEGDGVAEVYFFDESGTCVSQRYILPGEIIGSLPVLDTGKAWYDEDARMISAISTFDAGTHVLKAYNTYDPPTPPKDKGNENIGAYIGIGGAIIMVISLAVMIWCIRR